MEPENWTLLTELVSSIAILATLGYLAIQTRQNARALLANSRNALIATEVAVNQQVVENPSILLTGSKSDPTQEELVQLEVWLIQVVRTREHQWLQYRDGLLDEKFWDAYVNALRVILSRPIERAWWNFVKFDYFNCQFAEEVDRILSDMPIRDVQTRTIQRAIEAASL